MQDQRIITTTGIKCVGNTVVLHNVPYSPPYEITAIGDPTDLRSALDRSDYIDGYRPWPTPTASATRCRPPTGSTMPGYQGTLELRYARPLTAS